MRPRDEPSVILAAAELVERLGRLESELAIRSHPVCGAASVFIGQIHSGEIFNQYPAGGVARGNKALAARAKITAPSRRNFVPCSQSSPPDTGTTISCDWMMIRDAFALDPAAALVNGLSGMLPVECSLGLATAGRPQAIRRRRQQLLGAGGNSGDHTRPAPAVSTRFRSGSRSTTWSASPSCMRRRPCFTVSPGFRVSSPPP